MALIALGWLGWSEHQTYWSDMNAISIAFEGRQEMLKSLSTQIGNAVGVAFGGDGAFKPITKPTAASPEALVRNADGSVVEISPDLFDSLFPGKFGAN